VANLDAANEGVTCWVEPKNLTLAQSIIVAKANIGAFDVQFLGTLPIFQPNAVWIVTVSGDIVASCVPRVTPLQTGVMKQSEKGRSAGDKHELGQHLTPR
jgi:hypothetical protein